MNCPNLFQQMIGAVLAVLLLGGCGAPPTTRMSPAPTTTPTSTPPDNLLITEPIDMELVRVPAGEFLMGSDPAVDKYASQDDQPRQTVKLPEFYIGKYEVTNRQYGVFVKATGHRTPLWGNDTVHPGKESHPAVYVSWNDAVLFAKWLSDQTGMDFRLPSEAEWEKACRGTDGRLYPWGNGAPDAQKANYHGNVDTTTQVGSYSPQGDSPNGLADMAGNVWEWTSSLFMRYPYSAVDGREDMEATGRRVMRGGAFYWGDEKSVRCAERDDQWMVGPTFQDNDVGFRVVVHPSSAVPATQRH
jgi:formylglycine-generating enzyme required for sulfatase activity